MQKEFSVSSKDMYTRFNNGIGYVIAVDSQIADFALDIIRKYYPAEVIGNVAKGTGRVIMDSKYDSETLIFS